MPRGMLMHESNNNNVPNLHSENLQEKRINRVIVHAAFLWRSIAFYSEAIHLSQDENIFYNECIKYIKLH